MINKIRIKGNKKFDMACQQLAQFLIIFQQVKLNFVLPFSNHDDNSLMSIAAFYAFLFIFGTCGNAAILAVLHHVRSVDCRLAYYLTMNSEFKYATTHVIFTKAFKRIR